MYNVALTDGNVSTLLWWVATPATVVHAERHCCQVTSPVCVWGGGAQK